MEQEKQNKETEAAGISLTDYEKLQKELAEAKDKYVRLYAEFDNVRKRMEREKQEFFKYANEDVLTEFLNILDNLERTVEVAQKGHGNYSEFLKGVEMVMAQVYEMLKRNGVVPIEAKGKKFDPHYHEILMQEETAETPEGTVLEEFQKGYMYHDRVLRTVKIKIAVPKKVVG